MLFDVLDRFFMHVFRIKNVAKKYKNVKNVKRRGKNKKNVKTFFTSMVNSW